MGLIFDVLSPRSTARPQPSSRLSGPYHRYGHPDDAEVLGNEAFQADIVLPFASPGHVKAAEAIAKGSEECGLMNPHFRAWRVPVITK